MQFLRTDDAQPCDEYAASFAPSAITALMDLAPASDAELGARLRYEVRREFAPNVGVTWKESFAATHRLRRRGRRAGVVLRRR